MTVGAVDHTAYPKREQTAQERVLDHLALLKPRVMSLVVFTGAVGFVVAAWPIAWIPLALTLAAMAAGAGACGALNMWYDADIDGLMARTAARPIPRGTVRPRDALVIGVALSVLSVAALGLLVNGLSALLLAATIVIYVFVYTVWLKRRTPQNIVIGGAAGALPPMIGWAAATGSLSAASIGMFLLIFLWTPPHFWALALCRVGDYERVGIPMLPVVVGPVRTCWQILVYAMLLVPASFLPLWGSRLGWMYFAAAAAAGGVLLWRVIRVFQLRNGPQDALKRAAMGLFGFSILYMCVLFVVMLIEVVVV